MADRTREELRSEANLLITALMTDYRDNGQASDTSAEILLEIQNDNDLCGFIIGALVAIGISSMEEVCRELFDGDWAAAMADLRRGVV